MQHSLRLLCALAVLASPASSDILPPGHKPIAHELVLEASELWRGRRIVAAPVRGFGGVHVVEPGAPFRFSSKYGTRLYVASETEAIPEQLDDAWKAGHVSAAIPVSRIERVSVVSPLESVVTTLRIRALDAGRFELEVASEDRRREVWPLFAMVGAAMIGALGLAVFLRRRRRNAAAA